MVVVCKFSDDNFDLSPHTDQWPHTLNSMPSWGPDLVSSTVQSDYSDPSLSGYFQDMSLGQFNVIGDVVFYQPEFEECYYSRASGKHIGYLAKEILEGINSSVNYANYDNWDPNDIDDDNIKNEPDGQVDFIAICFRFADTYHLDLSTNPCNQYGSGYQGIAGLTGYRETFGNGVSQLILDGKKINAYLGCEGFGTGTFQNGVISLDGALGVMAHELAHYLFGCTHFGGLGYHGLMDGQGSGVMSSFERLTMGWYQPSLVNTTSPDIIIPDAITTGVVKKILIPGDPPDDYFLADNHQRLSYYESEWKRYNGGPLVSPGTGLIISHCTATSVDVESAFGRWNWKKQGTLYVFPFETEVVNRISGEDKLNLRNKNTTQGSQKNHPDILGSLQDFWNMNYNNIFSPWSNPSTYPDNSNLCIELLSFDQYKNAHVNIYLQNAYLAAPSKPQNLQVEPDGNLHPYLSWNSNMEPDQSNYKIYRYFTYENGWEYIGTSAHHNYYTDNSQTYCSSQPGTQCINTHNIYYRVTAIDYSQKESVPSDSVVANVLGGPPNKEVPEQIPQTKPQQYQLSINYPNPFNPTTNINYQLKGKGFVSLKVYDMLGREVAKLVSETQDEGWYSVIFNAANLPSGVYIYSLRINDFVQNNKMTLLK